MVTAHCYIYFLYFYSFLLVVGVLLPAIDCLVRLYQR